MKRCISLLEKTQEALIRKLRLLKKKDAEMVEIRMDLLKNPDMGKIMEACHLPVIITTRNNRNWDKYREALEFRPAFLDLDIGLPVNFIKDIIRRKKTTKIILSYHNDKRTPSGTELKKIIQKMRKMHADLPKIAVQINSHEDNLRLLETLIRETQKGKIIMHGIGEKARTGRLLAGLLGSEVVYLAINSKNKTAPGQWTWKEWNRAIGEILA